jgi:hypothetical protein
VPRTAPPLALLHQSDRDRPGGELHILSSHLNFTDADRVEVIRWRQVRIDATDSGINLLDSETAVRIRRSVRASRNKSVVDATGMGVQGNHGRLRRQGAFRVFMTTLPSTANGGLRRSFTLSIWCPAAAS